MFRISGPDMQYLQSNSISERLTDCSRSLASGRGGILVVERLLGADMLMWISDGMADGESEE